MTDMQRFDHNMPDEEGDFVLASDAEAAIAAAEQRGREAAYADYLHQKEPFAVWCMEQGAKNQRATFVSLVDAAFAKGEAQGQRDMLAKCITLIEESVPWSTDNWIAVDERAAILTALRALGKVDTPQQELNEHINLDKP